MSSIYPTTVPTKRLSESITGASSSFKLNNIEGWDGSDLTSADFGTKAYAVFRNSASTLMEIMEIDPTTIAASSVTILRRGLKFTGDLTTEVSANKLTWIKGDTIIELGTLVPQFLKHFVDILSDQTLAGIKNFSSIPTTDGGDAVTANQLVRKQQLDAAVLGALTTLNVVIPAVGGETLVNAELVYLDIADGEWKKADADTAASVENIILGITQGAGSDGVSITGGVLLYGKKTDMSGLTIGKVYASNTAGGFSASAGTKEVTLGYAPSATSIIFAPRYDQNITEDQQDALAGNSGTPSSSNRYVTELGIAGFSVYAVGDGSDGTYTLDGAQAAVSGLFGKSSNTYTLLRDAYFDTLTINNGITLKPAGYKLFVKNTLTNNGIIHTNGNAGGNATNGGSTGDNSGGSAGSAGAAGAVAFTSASLYGGVVGKIGGAGGGGSGGGGSGGSASSGGSGGAAGAAGTAGNRPRNLVNATLMGEIQSGGSFVTFTTSGGAGSGGGGGGGSGAGSGTNGSNGTAGDASAAGSLGVNGQAGTAGGGGGTGAGGGSGGGGGGGGGGGSGSTGGVMFISCALLAGNGAITATGGAGGNGGNGGNSTGGGGGGGGGAGGSGGDGGVIVIFRLNSTYTGTVTAAGGAAGSAGSAGTGDAAGTAGAAGNAGTAGVVIQLGG